MANEEDDADDLQTFFSDNGDLEEDCGPDFIDDFGLRIVDIDILDEPM